MNINQKSLAVLSSPYLFGISQVGVVFAALAPVRKFADNNAQVYAVDQLLSKEPPDGDGLFSRRRPNKGNGHCAIAIPFNRINRATRRRMAKVARHDPTFYKA